MRAEQSEDLADADRARRRHEAASRPKQPFAHQDEWGYKIYTAAVRRGDRRRRSVRRRGTGAAAQFPRPAAVRDAGRGLAPRQQAAAPADGAAEPHWEFDLEEGMLDTSRLPRIIIDPMYPLSFKREKDMTFRDTVRDAAAGQFRLDARAADHGGGDVRRHPGAARWSAARSRPKSWASPPAPGRAASRARNGSPTASRRIPAASTICATSSTRPPTSPGGGAQAQSRPDDARGPAEGEHRRRGADVGAQPPRSRRPEQRKILMVISDGAPVDDSTLSVNAGNYLERHLRRVIEEIEDKSERRTHRHRHRP